MKFLQTKNYKLKTSQGFTLVELLVASAIFSVVSIVAVGAILTINDANRKTQAIRAVVDNMNFTMESMSRKLRTGSNYHCDPITTGVGPGGTSVSERPCPIVGGEVKGATSMAYLSSEDITGNLQGQVVIYKLERPIPCTGTCRGRIITYKKDNNSTPIPVDMTPPEIDVQDLRFYVRTGRKPSVLISISGEIKLARANLSTSFNLQTTVSSRLR